MLCAVDNVSYVLQSKLKCRLPPSAYIATAAQRHITTPFLFFLLSWMNLLNLIEFCTNFTTLSNS